MHLGEILEQWQSATGEKRKEMFVRSHLLSKPEQFQLARHVARYPEKLFLRWTFVTNLAMPFPFPFQTLPNTAHIYSL
jgi:hypothetical protein